MQPASSLAEAIQRFSPAPVAFGVNSTNQAFYVKRETAETKQASTEPATLALLHSLHLMEYRNSVRWCDVNPLLASTLSRWPKPPKP